MSPRMISLKLSVLSDTSLKASIKTECLFCGLKLANMPIAKWDEGIPRIALITSLDLEFESFSTLKKG